MIYPTAGCVYAMQPGDTVVIDGKIRVADIYFEALQIDSVVTTEKNVDGNWLVKIPVKPKIVDFVENIVVGNKRMFRYIRDYGEDSGQFSMTIPDGMNLSSLTTVMYKKMRDLNYTDLKFNIADGVLTLYKKKSSELEQMLLGLPVEDMRIDPTTGKAVDPEPMVIEHHNPESHRVYLYTLARKLGITVEIKIRGGKIHLLKTSNEPRVRPDRAFQRKFIDWLGSLPHGLPTPIPESLVYDEAYTRTCIHRSRLDVRLVGGVVTRLLAALRKQDGQVVLRIRDEVVCVFDTNKTFYLRREHREVCDQLLAPLGLRYRDLRP